jgi:hypothetical protein
MSIFIQEGQGTFVLDKLGAESRLDGSAPRM